MGTNDSVKSDPWIWVMPLAQWRGWNFHISLPSCFIFGDMTWQNNFLSVGKSSIGRGMWKYLSDNSYSIEKIGHLSSDGDVGLWDTFWCKRVFMVYFWLRTSNQQLVRHDQSQPISPWYWKRKTSFVEWGINMFWCGFDFDARVSHLNKNQPLWYPHIW